MKRLVFNKDTDIDTIIIEIIKNKNDLEALNLSSNALNNQEVDYIFQTLLNNKVKLNYINLSNNPLIDDQIIQLLIECGLKYNTQLETINLQGTSVTDRGANKILEYLDKNYDSLSLCLKELTLPNEIDAKIRIAIFNLLEEKNSSSNTISRKYR